PTATSQNSPTGQKNMRKQSDPIKGKGTRRSCSRSRKRQTRRRNPSSFVAWCPTLLSYACVPGTSPTMLEFLPVVLTGPSTDDGIPFALSLQRVPFVLPSPQAASLPLGHSWG
uniref:Uncharacterized protein n=1 Tax=Cricetulus griseus TaxID=10029 RepID=A0A8C2QQ94_CRIGR